jgi:hypothetical protein
MVIYILPSALVEGQGPPYSMMRSCHHISFAAPSLRTDEEFCNDHNFRLDFTKAPLWAQYKIERKPLVRFCIARVGCQRLDQEIAFPGKL